MAEQDISALPFQKKGHLATIYIQDHLGENSKTVNKPETELHKNYIRRVTEQCHSDCATPRSPLMGTMPQREDSPGSAVSKVEK